MDNKYEWVIDAVGKSLRGLFQYSQNALEAYNESIEGMESRDRGVLQYAWGVDPELMSVEPLVRRTPYANPAGYKESLAGAAERGWLEPAGDNMYKLADKGRSYVDGLLNLLNQSFVDVPALPDADMDTLQSLLGKIIDTASGLDEPAETFALWFSTLFDRDNASLAYRMRRLLIKLLAFRDDAHIAAWSAEGLEGYALEALTNVWNKKAQTAEKLAEDLPYRMYDAEAYQNVLGQLAEKGLIADDNGDYVITPAGKALREGIETKTNQLYEKAFTALSTEDLDQLKSLLAAYVKIVAPATESEG